MLLILLLLMAHEPVQPDPQERVAFLSSHHPGVPAISAAQSGTDFLRYDISILIQPDSCSVMGTVDMELVVEDDIDTLRVDLDSSLEVEHLILNDTEHWFTHENDQIVLPLSEDYSPGDTLNLLVSYRGTPVSAGFGSFLCTDRDGIPQFWTLSQTDYAHTWWPCHDTPSDKAMVSIAVSVPFPPESFFVVSNGVLEDITSAEDVTTYWWRELYPIPPYLVSLAGTDYAMLTDVYASVNGDSIPFQYWVYPGMEHAAAIDFSHTPSMMRAFEDRYGAYPFLGEKYAMALIGRGGAMEHQTATSYGDQHIRGDNHFDWIIAHELAHQWWGDWITCDSWEDIWLNEGFASFSEAIWVEFEGGQEAYVEYMLGQDYLRTSGNEFPGTVFDPDYTFSITVYDKGSWVVHMLRRLLGEETFWNALSEYGLRHSYGTVRTSDLVAVCESLTGADLQWFFDQWLLREGRPHLDLSWTRTPLAFGDSVTVTITQTQAEPYRLPMELRFWGSDGDTTLSVEIIEPSESYDYYFPFSVTSWEADPNHDLLVWVDRGPGDPGVNSPPLLFYPPVPNPSFGVVSLALTLPAEMTAELQIYDLLGRRIWKSPTRFVTAGPWLFEWDGRMGDGRRVSSGLYIASVHAGKQRATFPLVRLP